MEVNGYPKNTYTTRYTPTNTSRLLCEGDMYTSMYDNDPEMKAVMENYNRQTSDRFKEYDEKMQDKRQKCKEQCDKAIQKIVLKDKLEKELTQKFSTLETNIDTNDMPTCVCKKSLADKTEKFCLNCGLGIGSGVLQASGLLGGIGAVAVNAWKPKALESAITAALKAGASNISAAAKAAGNAQGMKVVIYFLEQLDIDKLVPGICEQISRTGNYANITNFINTIIEQRGAMCGLTQELGGDMCKKIGINLGTIGQNGGHGLPDAIAIPAKVKLILDKATLTAKGKAAEVTTSKTLAIKAAQEKAIEAASTHLYTTIAYSITAVLIIVLIMVIIYLILRYRRKKKKEKKLQYIKLLEE
ncbi:PIR protein, putative [Plasmodium sp.]|nr:PIR protein, putative [Plasmodium sp.]